MVQAHGGDEKAAFDLLVAKRKVGALSAEEQFFREDVTHFDDGSFRAWKRLCKE